ncbi:hypothetical protein IE53DRAFT_386357 [Violaceomyces palustris]|uniref:Uncharacterized protein n=1 Tax=Violaceomyces palustris TaxID=1673888 RepID=A0ACD0NZR1_9BASI|nr:hypothetical protein IE53DRAFT_386357 [Violaceomyces palustris]
MLSVFKNPCLSSPPSLLSSSADRKKALEERIRNRGKRRLQKAGSEGSEDEGQDEVEHDGNGSKRAKKSKEGEDEVDAYLKEVRKHERSTLKDSGSGVRALVK